MADDPNITTSNVNTDDSDLDNGNAEMTPAAMDLQAGRVAPQPAIPENFAVSEKSVWDNNVTQHDIFQQTTNTTNSIGALGGAQFDLGGEGEMNTGALDNVDISLD